MTKQKYGSEVIIDILIDNHIEYVAFNPGATFRGIHDSLVNYQPDEPLKLIMCMHEEISIAIAHGYAKASGKLMAAIVHANIGLMHASMAIYNAWCDRVPMLILGGIGPLDTTKRRPWIDWIHTSQSQENIIRDYVKWCDQPYNLQSVPESLYRACQITNTDPKAPVYIGIDSCIQEDVVTNEQTIPVQHLLSPTITSTAPADVIKSIAQKLMLAKYPLILVDYTGRNQEATTYLIKLAELLAIPVIDCGGRYNFPNTHPLCLTGMNQDDYAQIDLILALDVHDLYGALGEMQNGDYHSYLNMNVDIIHVTLSDYLISKWAADFHKLYSISTKVLCDSYYFLRDIYEYCHAALETRSNDTYKKRFALISKTHDVLRVNWQKAAENQRNQNPLSVPSALAEMWHVFKDEDWVLTHNGGVLIGKWVKKLWSFEKYDSYIGESGGAGLGYALGASIGAALAHINNDNLCICLIGDGDFLFTPSALWTLSHYQIPLLIIVMNNRAYKNSKEHAGWISNQRKSNVENIHIGTGISEPHVDFQTLATSFGIQSAKAIDSIEAIQPTLQDAVKYIKHTKKSFLIDIIIE